MTAAASPVDVRRPVVAHTRAELAAALDPFRANGARVALVPTMGALHAGHTSLIRTARGLVDREPAWGLVDREPAWGLVDREPARGLVDRDGAVVVSIFVNPLQFGPHEDLARYPRSFDDDLAICAAEGVDVVFAPEADEVFPSGGLRVTVDPGPLGQILEGRSRPAHFRGVLTVVAKLFGLVRPELAVFGEKDYQQLVLVRQMAEDLCLGVEVVGAQTARETGGLALSSRNKYLDDEQRELALTLSRALGAGVRAGHHGTARALAAASAVLHAADGVALDYVELTSPDLGATPERGEGRLLVAGRVGTTRLIDNTALVLGQ